MCLVKFRFVLYVFIIELLSKGRKFFKRGLRSAGLNYWYFRKEKQMLKTKSIALNINTIKGNKQKHKINLRYSLLTSTKHESHKRSVYFYFLVMAQCFVVLLIFFISGESFGTTTSPQQQNIQQTKDLCEVRVSCVASDDNCWPPRALR